MRLPYRTFQAALDAAEVLAIGTGNKWYVNRLASSGVMSYEVSALPITDTSFGGGVVVTVHPPIKETK